MMFRVFMCLLVAAIFSTSPAQAVDILLDNTSGLSTTGLQFNNGSGFGGNTSAYTRVNGFTFSTASQSYDISAISIPMGWNSTPSVSPTIRVSVFENSSTSANTPAGGASPAYTQDYSSNTFSTTIAFYTFSPTATWNLKANTSYSIWFGTTQTTSPTSLWWATYSTTPGTPSSGYGFTYTTNFFSTNGGTAYSTTGNKYPVQMTGTAVAVPEPSTYALGTLALLVLATAGKRVRRA